MKLIFSHSNDEAYSLLDAIVSIFVTSLTLLAVLFFVRMVLFFSGRTIEKMEQISNMQNERNEKILSACE